MKDQVNLETCDQEPIHLIGAVQPHGALVALNDRTLTVEYASRNTGSFLNTDPEGLLGKHIAEIIGPDNTGTLSELPLEPSTPGILKPWFLSFDAPDGTRIDAECLPHRNNGHIVLEFLHPDSSPAPFWQDELLRQGIVTKLFQSGGMSELAEASARMIRDVTGFDRVMIYKFAEDKHGEVIAEATNRPDSFLGLHYPASDIPDPARRHFTLNVMRSIPDINSVRVPIVGRSGETADAASDTPLDLTYSNLRAVAPVHVEYLNNMGVGASLSISLITNNELWGLVACHHYGPRHISSSRLRFAELLGGTTAALLQSIENSMLLSKSIEAEKTAYAIEQQARDGTPLRALIDTHAAKLMELFRAQGLRLVLGDDVVEIGDLPPHTIDFAPLRAFQSDGVATTSHLSELVDLDAGQRHIASGAAILTLSEDDRDWMVLVRPEFEETINWAGKPEKLEATSDDGTKRLTPRGSFALWREERLGMSQPFDAADRDALRILRRALFALNSIEREHAAIEAQRLAEAEEYKLRHALLDEARTSSMGELASAISHELNQPLSAVANYLEACRKELLNTGIAVPQNAESLINEALTESLRAGDLLHRIRDFVSSGDLNSEHIDLNAAIRQGVDLALVTSQLSDLEVHLDLSDDLPPVFADRVQIGQVVLNLARNSLAAMKASETQVLTVTSAVIAKKVRVTVSDTGRGIPPDARQTLFQMFRASTNRGMGVGLSLCRSILEAHGGRIWLDSGSPGARFAFELPLLED